jgi:hypothetical protein
LRPIHEWTVAIRPLANKKLRKLTKITDLGGDGFSILVPCHKARTGYLFKHPVIPDLQMPRFVAWEKATAFTARDGAKLSYHTDGFVEFSGTTPGRIKSGQDLVSGETEGLGLFAAPLSRPSFSGPTASITVYGVDQFEKPKKRDRLVVFEPGDFYYRSCTPETANTWSVAIYAFPKNVVPPIRFKQGRPTLEVTLEPLNGPIASIMDMEAIFLTEEKMFLGLCVNCFNTQLQANSGWLLSGPGNYTRDRRGHVLMGMYPRTEIPLPGKTPLQRRPKSSPADSSRLPRHEPAHRGLPATGSNKNTRRKPL